MRESGAMCECTLSSASALRVHTQQQQQQQQHAEGNAAPLVKNEGAYAWVTLKRNVWRSDASRELRADHLTLDPPTSRKRRSSNRLPTAALEFSSNSRQSTMPSLPLKLGYIEASSNKRDRFVLMSSLQGMKYNTMYFFVPRSDFYPFTFFSAHNIERRFDHACDVKISFYMKKVE